MKCISLTTAVALVMFAVPAWALPENAEMHVSGAVTAASTCSLDISNGGAIDLGEIHVSALNQGSPTALGDFARTISVTCDTPTRFALSVIDNRVDTLSTERQSCLHCLGMGRTTSQQSIGFYALRFDDEPIVDGVATAPIMSNVLNEEWGWQVAFGYYLTPRNNAGLAGALQYVAAAQLSTANVASATSVSIQFRAEVSLESRNTMAITQATAIDGNATIELHYL